MVLNYIKILKFNYKCLINYTVNIELNIGWYRQTGLAVYPLLFYYMYTLYLMDPRIYHQTFMWYVKNFKTSPQWMDDIQKNN